MQSFFRSLECAGWKGFIESGSRTSASRIVPIGSKNDLIANYEETFLKGTYKMGGRRDYASSDRVSSSVRR